MEHVGINITQSCVSSAARCPSHPFCSPSWIPDGCDTDHWMSGALWLGGEALADHLLATPGLVRGARVLELGAGTGIVGLTAALAGAAEVKCARKCHTCLRAADARHWRECR
jgi:methylase of polypeptide subunit release factors